MAAVAPPAGVAARWRGRPSTIETVQFRQILVVLLTGIAIVGAALFVLSWTGDDNDPDDSEANAFDAVDASDDATASSTITTTIVPVATSIPVDCGVDPDPTGDTIATTTTTTTPEDLAAPADDIDDIDDEEDDDRPLLPTLAANSTLSTVGLDEVTFGLTVNQARQAAGTEFDACGAVTRCYRVTPALAPDGISFLVHEGTIERADIVGGPITTSSGAGVGTTSERLDELFGDRLERTDLGGGREDVIFVPADENDAEFRVAFTLADGVVETMRAGRADLVLAADPCSI